MEKNQKPIQLPPGFRFHPSDEELIVHYLRRKATKTPLPASIVADVELYKLNPWDLPKKSLFGDEEWYFFTPRDRKYPNGLRPNRMAASGYWKATGIDKPILTSCGSKVIGVKKALVFYIGRPPKGNKTDWIMHEYRLPESDHASSSWSNKKDNSMRLDEWVLCRVRQKTGSGMPFGNVPENRNGSSCSTVQKLDHIQCSPPNFDLVRENYPCQEDYCPLIPFLFGNSDHQEFPTSTDTAVSCISFEFVGEGNNNINKASSSSLACEDNFNIDNYNLRKRKLLGQGGLLVNGHEENIGHSTNKKKVNNIRDYDQQQLPAPSSENDYAGDRSGMISSYQLAQNNHVDQSMMMYQDLYNSFAFT